MFKLQSEFDCADQQEEFVDENDDQISVGLSHTGVIQRDRATHSDQGGLEAMRILEGLRSKAPPLGLTRSISAPLRTTAGVFSAVSGSVDPTANAEQSGTPQALRPRSTNLTGMGFATGASPRSALGAKIRGSLHSLTQSLDLPPPPSVGLATAAGAGAGDGAPGESGNDNDLAARLQRLRAYQNARK